MILAIHTYPGANKDLSFHWPFFRRAGFERIIVVGTHGGGCHIPPGAEYVEIGDNKHVAGDHLPRRLVDTAEWCLRCGGGWDQLCIAEYDCVFFRPLPKLDPGFHGHLAGGQLPGCKSTFFYHFPYIADRASWETFVKGGRELLAAGEIEQGTPDAFLALTIERYGIAHHFHSFKSYSRNTIHASFGPGQPDFIPEARQAVRDGAVVCHGIKTSKTYRTSSPDVIRQILS